VDRGVAGRGRDPRPGIPRHALDGPGLERPGEAILHRLLSEIEVAQDPDQRRNRPTRLLAEEAIDELVSSTGFGQALMSRRAGSSRRQLLDRPDLDRAVLRARAGGAELERLLE